MFFTFFSVKTLPILFQLNILIDTELKNDYYLVKNIYFLAVK